MRWSVSVAASSVFVLDTSRLRTRDEVAFGPSRRCIMRRSTKTTNRMVHGATNSRRTPMANTVTWVDRLAGPGGLPSVPVAWPRSPNRVALLSPSRGDAMPSIASTQMLRANHTPNRVRGILAAK